MCNYHGESSLVECMTFNQEGEPIGGGSAHPNAGVARVIIQVPKNMLKQNQNYLVSEILIEILETQT